MTKEQVKIVAEQMPETFTLQELIEKLMVVDDINTAREAVKNGKYKTNEEAQERIRSWSK